MLQKQNLTLASRELYRRTPDETFDSLNSLFRHCQKRKEESSVLWRPPMELRPQVGRGSSLGLGVGDQLELQLNDWSFGQLCQMANVRKETVNRLSPDTASRVFTETLPRGSKTQVGMLRDVRSAADSLSSANAVDSSTDSETF